MSARVVSLFVLFSAMFVAGCWRDSTRLYVTAPFNEETELAEIRAVWRNTGEERNFNESSRLDEVRFQYKVDVHSRLEHRIYLQLGGFELLDDDRLSLGRSDESVKCVLGPGDTEAVLEGSVWVPKRSVKRVASFRLDRFGVPLSNPGRAMYREWLLQNRPGEDAAIDSEMARYAAAPACR
jgi:hypothetical protein